jgi:hypothetical protein
VTGVSVTDDGAEWFQLNKGLAAPQSAASEIWIRRGDADESGDCDNISEADAPPIIQIEPTAVPGATDVPPADSLITPSAGTWRVTFSGSITTTCPGGETLQLPALSNQNLTVTTTASGISVNGRALARVAGTNTFEGVIQFFPLPAPVSVTFTSPTAGTGTAFVNVINLDLDGVECQGAFTFTMSL